VLDFENGAVDHYVELPQIPNLIFGNPYSSSYLSSLSLGLSDCMFAFHLLESQCVKSSWSSLGPLGGTLCVTTISRHLNSNTTGIDETKRSELRWSFIIHQEIGQVNSNCMNRYE
jgi:hypothetical protein